MNSETIEQIIANVEGWISPDEACFLYDSATKVPSGQVIVEVGSWKGLSTILLSLGSKDGNLVQIYAIDPHHGANQEFERQSDMFHTNPMILHPTLDEFMHNIRTHGHSDVITPIANFSEYAATYLVRRPIGFIFIDAIHDYKNVTLDFSFWYPKVAIGGYMAFHDSANTSFKGSEQAVKEHLIDSGHFDDVSIIGCIVKGRKIR